MFHYEVTLLCKDTGCDEEIKHTGFIDDNEEIKNYLVLTAGFAGWEVKGDKALCPKHFREALDEENCEQVDLNDVVNPSGYVPQPYEG